MATNSHVTHSVGRRRTIVLLALLTIAGAVCTASLGARVQRSIPRVADGAYGWPVKPFDRPHPVRGAFGDPRTSFNGPPTPSGLSGPGSFSFHHGVDISAPDGTAVYAVKSGVARLRSRETVVVKSDDGVSFEYWHIVPTVRPGQRVTAHETVLGRIRPGGYEHVHLTEIRNGRPVNPLARGHLTPYADSTRPHVDSASFLQARNGRTLLPEFLHGRVQFVISSADETALPLPGRWKSLSVAPTRITWRIERAKDGSVVVPQTEAFDVRVTLPDRKFWQVYARGTRQNMANFAGHKLWRQPGHYLFRLTASFDTHRLKDDIYALVATASDTRGNSGSGRFVFTIHNRPGFFG